MESEQENKELKDLSIQHIPNKKYKQNFKKTQEISILDPF